ncbi:MAG: plasmid stabilization protein [Lautropia sp.]|nr:plasmid stabilization protein [Lautropia sp.]
MAVITIRNLEDETKTRLRLQAALHGHSMEEEARTILKAALDNSESESGTTLIEAIRKRVAPVGGIELEIPERDALPMAPAPSA